MQAPRQRTSQLDKEKQAAAMKVHAAKQKAERAALKAAGLKPKPKLDKPLPKEKPPKRTVKQMRETRVQYGEVIVAAASGDKARPGQFRPNTSGNPNGRPAGARTVLTEAKLRLLNLHGQTPLEFLTAVFRNQLFDEYDVHIVDEARGLAQVFPKTDPITGLIVANQIHVALDQRISAATSAAPYMHRKKPLAIDGGEGKPIGYVSADQLAKLSDADLERMLTILGKVGAGASFEGGEAIKQRLED